MIRITANYHWAEMISDVFMLVVFGQKCSLLPFATVVAERLCFHRHLSFCSWGEHVWRGSVRDRGVCLVGGHAWQGCVCGRGACMVGACMVGGYA